MGLQKLSKLSLEEISYFFKLHRRSINESNILQKFQEVAYKSIVHVFLMFFGFYFVVYKQDWIWNNASCWTNYPFMPVYKSIYWYYMIEFGSYIHEFIYFFTEVKRSDYWEMLIHHLATLFLIAGSYIVNFMPIGAIIMIIHDMVDFLLEFAKLFNYMKAAGPWAVQLSDHLFTAFAIVFFLTRCVLYPYVPIKNLIESRGKRMPPSTTYDVLVAFCLVLQILHIIWLVMIIKMAIRLSKGGGTKDERSDEELPEDDGDEEIQDEEDEEGSSKTPAESTAESTTIRQRPKRGSKK